MGLLFNRSKKGKKGIDELYDGLEPLNPIDENQDDPYGKILSAVDPFDTAGRGRKKRKYLKTGIIIPILAAIVIFGIVVAGGLLLYKRYVPADRKLPSSSDSTDAPWNNGEVVKEEGLERELIVPADPGFDYGYYAIVVKDEDGSILRPVGGKNVSGTACEIWDDSDIGNEIFFFEKQEDGFFKIIHQGSGLSLDVREDSAKSGVYLQLKEYMGTDGQKWSVIPEKDGSYLIRSSLGTYITCENNGTHHGTNMVMDIVSGKEGQKWNLYAGGVITDNGIIRDGRYQISSKSSGLFLSVKDETARDGSSIVLTTDDSSILTFFDIEKVEEGYYLIHCLESDQVVSVKDYSTKKGTAIVTYAFNVNQDQKWAIQKLDDGCFEIMSSLGSFMDVEGKTEYDGLSVYPYGNNDTQKWELLPGGVRTIF